MARKRVRRWKPEYGEAYWYIDNSDCYVSLTERSKPEKLCFKLDWYFNNVFHSKKQAESVLKKIRRDI